MRNVFDLANKFFFVSGSVKGTLIFVIVREKEYILKTFFKKLISSLKTVSLLTFLRKLLEELNKIRTLIIRTVQFVNGVDVIASLLLHMAFVKLD